MIHRETFIYPEMRKLGLEMSCFFFLRLLRLALQGNDLGDAANSLQFSRELGLMISLDGIQTQTQNTLALLTVVSQLQLGPD